MPRRRARRATALPRALDSQAAAGPGCPSRRAPGIPRPRTRDAQPATGLDGQAPQARDGQAAARPGFPGRGPGMPRPPRALHGQAAARPGWPAARRSRLAGQVRWARELRRTRELRRAREHGGAESMAARKRRAGAGPSSQCAASAPVLILTPLPEGSLRAPSRLPKRLSPASRVSAETHLVLSGGPGLRCSPGGPARDIAQATLESLRGARPSCVQPGTVIRAGLSCRIFWLWRIFPVITRKILHN